MTAIRRLHAEDASDARMFMERFGAPGREIDDPEGWLAENRHVFVAAWRRGEPAGLVYGYALPRFDDGPPRTLLYSLDVAPAHRRQGVGRALVKAFLAACPAGAWVLTNESNEPAMAVYRSVGGERPNPDDVMLRLPPVT